MAEQAQKEPTMEEILSSIRKIIADDDAPEVSAEADVVEDSEVFEDDLMEAEPDLVDLESQDDVLAAIGQSMDEVAEEFDANTDAEDSFEFVVGDDSFDTFEEDAFEGVEDITEPELEAAPVEEAFEPAPTPVIEEEVPMTAKPAPLTDTATVTAAAGALGKLLANVEFGEEAGGPTTIEGLVREMLRPMLKEWLDENLPSIVEKQVEAEVQRIARMAG
ncbi:MAG: DUF2497 domain-containing protein [Pseudomonadota bacterium]